MRTEAPAGQDSRLASAALFLVDQVIASGARFGLAWSLARWTGRDNYGAFALVTSVLLMLEVGQQALVTWPMAVIGSTRTGDALRGYVAALSRIQVLTSCALAAAAAVAVCLMPAGWFGGRVTAHALGAAALLFGQQLQEFNRRVLLTLRPAGALLNDAAAATLLLCSLAVLRVTDSALASDRVLVLAACAYAVAAAVGWRQTRTLRGPMAAPLREVVREGWEFGRWIVGGRLGEGLLSHVHNFVLGAFAGAGGVAALQAPRLVVAPLQVASFAALNYLLPRGAQVLHERGPAPLAMFVGRAAGLFVAAAVLYVAVPVAAPHFVLGLLYSTRYDDPVLLRLWCAVALVATLRTVLSVALYVPRRSDLIMHAVLTCGTLAALASIALAAGWYERGAAVAMLAGELGLLLWVAVLWRRGPGRPAAAA